MVFSDKLSGTWRDSSKHNTLPLSWLLKSPKSTHNLRGVVSGPSAWWSLEGERNKPGQFASLHIKVTRRLKTKNFDWEQSTSSWSRWITKQHRSCFYTNTLHTKTKERKLCVGCVCNVLNKQDYIKRSCSAILRVGILDSAVENMAHIFLGVSS